jgi:ribulose-phosphate 3-epimerase
MEVPVEVVPTILVESSDEFKRRFRRVEPFVGRVQWDIMDGIFVNNTTFSDVSVLKSLASKLPIEVDLMVSDPNNWIDRFINTQVDRLIFHVESTAEPEVLIQEAKSAGFEVGLTLDPDTPFKQVREYLDELDIFQAMGVESGFGGQAFVPSVLDRIAEVRRLYPDLSISVDGGVNAESAPRMVAAGADALCAGSFIFDSDNIEEAVYALARAGNRMIG